MGYTVGPEITVIFAQVAESYYMPVITGIKDPYRFNVSFGFLLAVIGKVFYPEYIFFRNTFQNDLDRIRQMFGFR